MKKAYCPPYMERHLLPKVVVQCHLLAVYRQLQADGLHRRGRRRSDRVPHARRAERGSLISVHHTVLAIAAWLVFSLLAIGRKQLGWRGSVASRWTVVGFILLALGYFGSKLNELIIDARQGQEA